MIDLWQSFIRWRKDVWQTNRGFFSKDGELDDTFSEGFYARNWKNLPVSCIDLGYLADKMFKKLAIPERKRLKLSWF